MNLKQSLVVLGCAALCGIAFAQNQKPPTVAERLDVLERQSAELRKELASVKAAAAADLGSARKDAQEARALANALAQWATTQSESAAELARVLDDSEAKGFTFGINPDSRVALLSGWRNFATKLQADVPKPLPPPAPAPSEGSAPAK